MREQLLGGLMATLVVACSGSAASDLDEVHQSIETRFSEIQHLEPDAFAALKPGEYVIFDVREKGEFHVSHISGAVWVDPSISAQEFLDRFGARLSGKQAVFYCSVGERSSRLAQRVKEKDGSLVVHNLEKGIFGWHNEGRDLKRGDTHTDKIHPYDEKWGQLIHRQKQVSYQVE